MAGGGGMLQGLGPYGRGGVGTCCKGWGHVTVGGGISQGLVAYGRGICQMSKSLKMLTMNEVHKIFNLTQ